MGLFNRKKLVHIYHADTEYISHNHHFIQHKIKTLRLEVKGVYIEDLQNTFETDILPLLIKFPYGIYLDFNEFDIVKSSSDLNSLIHFLHKLFTYPKIKKVMFPLGALYTEKSYALNFLSHAFINRYNTIFRRNDCKCLFYNTYTPNNIGITVSDIMNLCRGYSAFGLCLDLFAAPKENVRFIETLNKLGTLGTVPREIDAVCLNSAVSPDIKLGSPDDKFTKVEYKKFVECFTAVDLFYRGSVDYVLSLKEYFDAR